MSHLTERAVQLRYLHLGDHVLVDLRMALLWIQFLVRLSFRCYQYYPLYQHQILPVPEITHPHPQR